MQRVSSDLGYESPTAFVVMFKKALGTTPAAISQANLPTARRASTEGDMRCGATSNDCYAFRFGILSGPICLSDVQ
ncbi:AraC-like DNA-binding protein [Rhizobium sp. BK312]|nr:AraC-like DNA-binding protein [Rhizobium sp. BK312]